MLWHNSNNSNNSNNNINKTASLSPNHTHPGGFVSRAAFDTQYSPAARTAAIGRDMLVQSFMKHKTVRDEILQQISSRVALRDPALQQFISVLFRLTMRAPHMFAPHIACLKVCKGLCALVELRSSPTIPSRTHTHCCRA